MIRTPKDLRQIAYDAGVQMGRAHPKRPTAARQGTLQGEVLRSFESLERADPARDAARWPARTDAAWRQFRQEGGRTH